MTAETKKPKPKVFVGLRKGRMYVVASYAAGPGTYINKEPVYECSPCDVAEIGSSVLAGLESFVDHGEWPDWDTFESPVLKATGLSNWSEFTRGLRDCSVYKEEKQYHIYTELPHIYLPLDSTPEQIGRAVLKALGTSEEKEQRKAERRRRNT